MDKIFAILSFITEVMPLVLKLITFVEERLGDGKGPAKLAIVLNTVEAAAKLGGKTADEITALRAPLTAVVTSVVAAYNEFKAWPQGD